MSHLEKNEPTLPINSPELKSEIALILGRIANNLAQRIDDRGQAGGAREIRTYHTELASTACFTTSAPIQTPEPVAARPSWREVAKS